MHSLSFFFALKDGILNIPGKRFKPNGYSIDKPKLINVSFINIICVFTYTAQKQEIKYQKNTIIKKLYIKKIINLIFKKDSSFLDLYIIFFLSVISLSSKIFFSDNDKVFKII